MFGFGVRKGTQRMSKNRVPNGFPQYSFHQIRSTERLEKCFPTVRPNLEETFPWVRTAFNSNHCPESLTTPFPLAFKTVKKS